MKGFDHDDKEKKLPFAASACAHRASCAWSCAHTNLVNGCWVTVGGDDAEFIKKPIAMACWAAQARHSFKLFF